MLKELLYYLILYDYGTDQEEEEEDGILDLDTASLEHIEKVLGAYKDE